MLDSLPQMGSTTEIDARNRPFSLVKKQNIATIDEIISYLLNLESRVKIKIIGTQTYCRTYLNFLNVIIRVLRNDYPIEAILRNRTRVTLHNHEQASFVTETKGHKGVEYDIINDIITISSLPYMTDKGMKVKLHGCMRNGEVFAIFFNNIYKNLPVKGKTVIDVGSNIGDSSIYFALRGADKVIGVEPFPKNYETAKKNVELNNLSNKITVLLSGCAAKSGYVNVDPGYESSTASYLSGGLKNGTNVPLLTLENLLDENHIRSGEAVLKMDCEGCEYDTILSSTDSVLRQFSHMQIEYHYGYNNLKNRLEESGFNVSVIRRPILQLHPDNNEKMYIGDIFARLA
jgi:FkbM family methyltransferase